jgi:hypothetical protein
VRVPSEHAGPRLSQDPLDQLNGGAQAVAQRRERAAGVQTARALDPLAADVSVAGAAAGRGLCCPAAVPVMEAADHGCLDDPALIEALHRSGLWGVLV